MKQRFKVLNSLKILFALGIVYGHYIGNMVSVSNSELSLLIRIIWTYGGMVGNTFFFITSGFLIAFNYKYKCIKGDISLEQFLGGRIKKLMPYFLFGVTLDLVVVIIDRCLRTDLFTGMNLTLEGIVLSYLMLYRGISSSISQYFNGSLWFMCCLVFAYALYYFLVRFMVKNDKTHTYVYGILFCFTFASKGLISGNDTFCFPQSLTRTIVFFLMGVLLYEIYEKYETKCFSLFGAILSAIVCLGSLVSGAENIMGNTEIAVGFFILPSIILLALHSERICKLLSYPLMQMLAKYTTALYVTHGPVINVMHVFGRWITRHTNYEVKYDTITCFIIVSGTIFLVTWSSERLIERYWRLVSDKLIIKRKGEENE